MTDSPFAARLSRMSESATAAVFRRVAELRAQGVELISLSVGEPDFDPPAHVGEAMKRAIDAGLTRYTEVAGMAALRRAIAADSLARRGFEHGPDSIVVSAGAKHALFNLAQALFDHGDEVIVPLPAWGTYAEQVRLCGATPKLLPCRAEDGFLLQPQALAEALGERTKALILCSPCNPTGAAYGRAELEALAQVLRPHRAFVIIDEIYAGLTYDGFEQQSLLTVAPDLGDRIIIVDGVSKRYAMTGYRVGWLLASPAIARACEAIQSQCTTSITAPAQVAAQAALEGPQDAVEAMRAQFERRRKRVLEGLTAIAGLRVQPPRGAFYAFVDVRELAARGPAFGDDLAIARHLLDKARVAVVPGSAFDAPGYLRLSFAASDAELEQALERIGDALA